MGTQHIGSFRRLREAGGSRRGCSRRVRVHDIDENDEGRRLLRTHTPADVHFGPARASRTVGTTRKPRALAHG